MAVSLPPAMSMGGSSQGDWASDFDAFQPSGGLPGAPPTVDTLQKSQVMAR